MQQSNKDGLNALFARDARSRRLAFQPTATIGPRSHYHPSSLRWHFRHPRRTTPRTGDRPTWRDPLSQQVTRRVFIACVPFKDLALRVFFLAAPVLVPSSSWSQGNYPIQNCTEYVARAMSQVHMGLGCNFPG